MNKVLHPKIQALKRKAAPINFNAVSVNEYGALETTADLLDKRIIQGYAVIWGQKNLYSEIFIKGAFANTLNQRGPASNSNYKIKFLYQHDQSDPLALFDELTEDETGLFFRTKPLDDVGNAERVITQIKSGTLNNFSIGWDYIWDKMEYDEVNDAIIVKEANLFEISVVTIPADMSTFAYRSIEQLDILHDDTEYFIKSLPRSFQLEARNIFARHKAFVNNSEPLEQTAQSDTALNDGKPPKVNKRAKPIDFNYLTKNFSLK